MQARCRRNGSSRRAARALVALVGLSLVPSGVSAQPRAARLQWRWQRGPGASGCIDSERLRERVQARLGRAAFVSDGADATLAGRIAATESGFEIDFTLTVADEPIARRRLSSDRRACRSLDDTLAVVAALLAELTLDPTGVAAPATIRSEVQLTIPTEPTEPPPAAVQPPRAQLDLPRTSRGESGRFRIGVRLDAVASFGSLPGTWPAPAGRLAGSVEWGPLTLELAAAQSGRTLGNHRGKPVVAADLRWLALAACTDWRLHEALCAGPCATLEAGMHQATGRGLDEIRSGQAVWMALGISARLRASVGEGPFEAFAELAAVAPFRTSRFVASLDPGPPVTVFRPWPVVSRLALGLGVRSP
ncbi:MAG: hypothetical protein RMK74_17130 [Myxococcales bacterium]|nr:hypothetical protein [Myxococcales bacterium]